MVSSGIWEGAWEYPKWGHIKPIERDGQIVAASVVVYASEENEEYLTFMSPEAYFALKEWMERRERAGEKVTKDSWLMRNLWASRVAFGKGGVTIPKKIRATGVRVLMQHALYAQGIRKASGWEKAARVPVSSRLQEILQIACRAGDEAY